MSQHNTSTIGKLPKFIAQGLCVHGLEKELEVKHVKDVFIYIVHAQIYKYMCICTCRGLLDSAKAKQKPTNCTEKNKVSTVTSTLCTTCFGRMSLCFICLPQLAHDSKDR